jgi:hypothetical protein
MAKYLLLKHYRGGLATQYAVSLTASDGSRVAGHVAEVITIGIRSPVITENGGLWAMATTDELTGRLVEVTPKGLTVRSDAR